MKFRQLDLKGLYLIETVGMTDARGSFTRTFCAKTLNYHKLESEFVQSNIGSSIKSQTLRGMHFQVGQSAETKIVSCVKGKVFDVVIDCRVGSLTRFKWFGIELSESDNLMIYIPSGFAHGYLTLLDNSQVSYMVNKIYDKSSERGIRWDDPLVNIDWPIKPNIISEKDMNWTFINKEIDFESEK